MRLLPVVLAAAAAAGTVVAAGPAHSAWTATGQAPVTVHAASLAAPGAVTAGAPTASSVVLRWGAAAPLPSGTVGYVVERTAAGAPTRWTAACGTSATAPTTSTSCTDTGLAAASGYRYRVTAVYADWRRQGSPSGTVTTAAAAGTQPGQADPPSVWITE